jgi:voltage-gated potassium channel
MSDPGRSEGPPGGSEPPGGTGESSGESRGHGEGSDGDARPGVEPPALRARRGVLGLVGVLVIYYAVPVGELPTGSGVLLSVVGLLGGMVLLAWAIVRQLQRLMHSRPGDATVRIDSLVFLIIIVVPMFAAGYYALEQGDGSQFASLTTKTDSLYFTLSTLATVGFGDVHAAGQVARALVALQITFDLVFVAALASVVTGYVRERAASRRAAR